MKKNIKKYLIKGLYILVGLLLILVAMTQNLAVSAENGLSSGFVQDELNFGWNMISSPINQSIHKTDFIISIFL